VKFGIIMDVEASRAIRQAEVGAAKTMIERTEQRFDIKPERLAGDTAYGSGANLNWLVNEAKIAPHIPVVDKSKREDGVARTKHLAKIASQVAKPDGLVVVDPETELDFLHDLPVGLMWGVGPVTQARLAEIGVHTIGQLAKMPGYSLE